MRTTPANIKERTRRTDYPVHCIECGKKEVYPAVVRETWEQNHDGRIYKLTIDDLPVLKCRACGDVSYGLDADDRMTAELRRHLGLLTPESIRANLESLHVTQKEAAEGLGIAAETLSRWLSGGLVQSRAMDNLLRAFFGSPVVRRSLTNFNLRRKFGEVIDSEVFVQRAARCEDVGEFEVSTRTIFNSQPDPLRGLGYAMSNN